MTLHFRFVAQRSAQSRAAPQSLTQGSRESPLRNIDEEVGGKAKRHTFGLFYRGQILLRHKIRRPLQAGLAWLTMRAISGDATDKEYELLKDIRHMRQVSSGHRAKSFPNTRKGSRFFLDC